MQQNISSKCLGYKREGGNTVTVNVHSSVTHAFVHDGMLSK